MSSPRLVILTGASRANGFGKAVAMEFALSFPDTDFVLLARDAAGLEETAASLRPVVNASRKVTTLSLDLSNLDTLDDALSTLFASLPSASAYSHIYLINNAGSLGPLHYLSEQKVSDVRSIIDFNITSTLALSTAFLRHFSPSAAAPPSSSKLYIINISSLMAAKAFPAWGVYCLCKAARKMMHEVLAEEAKELKTNLRVLSYQPGPLNTEMAAEICESPDNQNKGLQQWFIESKEQGKLLRPEESAKVLMGLLTEDTWENGISLDIYDVKK